MKRGFTIIEILVSITMFLVVMTISMGSIISVFDSNRKSASLRAVMGNLNLAVESMSREMRFGKDYHCDVTVTPITTPRNCPSGDTSVSFLSSDGIQISYRMSGSTIEKSVAGNPYIAVTAPEIQIDDLRYHVLGAVPADPLQPRVLVLIKGHSGVGEGRTDFTLQTLTSQRVLDN